MIAQEINQAKDQVTAKQQALNGQENLRTANKCEATFEWLK